MALVKTWYEPEAAADKFGVPVDKIIEWVEEGVIRCEREKDEVVRVNIDDLKLELQDYLSERD